MVHEHVPLNLDLGERDDKLFGSLRPRAWCAGGYMPSFVSDSGEEAAQPDDD